MSPAQGTTRPSGHQRGTSGNLTPLPHASVASTSPDDTQMRDVSELQETVKLQEVSAEDAQANTRTYDEDERMSEGEEQIGLADIGFQSVMGAIEQVNTTSSKPSRGSKLKPVDVIRQRLNEMRLQRQALDSAKAPTNKPTAADDPIGNTMQGVKRSPPPWSPSVSTPAPKKTKAFEYSFADIMKQTKPFRCAMMIDTWPVIGNPFNNRPGFKMAVQLDAGKMGTPSIGLNFSLSKDGTDSDDNDLDHYNHFTVGYEPGIKIEGKFMLEALFWEKAKYPKDEKILDMTFPPEIKKFCKSKHDEDNLYWMSYAVNSHRARLFDPEWVLNLKSLPADERNAVGDNLLRMMDDKGTYQVHLWFLNHRAVTRTQEKVETFQTGCLEPLRAAVKNHLPPLHQYRDENGDPLIHLNMPPIRTVGDGMYVRYSKPKADGTAEVTTQGKVGFLNIPKKVTWEQIKDFYIYNAVPIVREYHFTEVAHANMQKGFHRVFLERMPLFLVNSKKITPNQKLWRNSFFAGIRMNRDNDGAKSAVPPENSFMKIDFNAASIADYEEADHRDGIWYGRVVSRPKELLQLANVDFWVLISRPITVRSEPTSYVSVLLRPDSKLPKAKVSVTTNPSMALRELKAIKKFCDDTQLQGLLGEIRLALMSDPNRAKTVKYKDLSYGPKGKQSNKNKAIWDSLMTGYSKSRKDNPSQMAVLRSVERMRSNLVTCSGPPGAGKTTTLSDMIMALGMIGHTILCVSASNTAVDLDATTVYRALGDEGRKQLKLLRLGSDGAEQAAILAKVNYGAYKQDFDEQFKNPEYNPIKEAQDHPLLRNALDKIATEFADLEIQMEQLLKQYDTVEQAYASFQTDRRFRKSNVDVGMTLDYRIWEITQADREAAFEDYNAARAQMTDQEFTAALAEQQISVDHFDKSAEYRECINNYIASQGKLSAVQREHFEAVSDEMVSRVLVETHVLFTTASNAGGKLLENGASFKPSVIMCDEANHISIPSLCVPITSFDSWEGLFLFGDPNQLDPTFTSGQFNELLANGKMSPLAMCYAKGFPGLLLDTQYRMCPAIAMFPNYQFYDGKLKNHPKTEQDNGFRQKMRKVSEYFGIAIAPRARSGVPPLKLSKQQKKQAQRQATKQGSEYFVVDVKYGTSRIEEGSTSLVNYANATMVLQVAERMILEGIEARHIKILTYYQGQRRLLQKMIKEATGPAWTDEIKDAIEISTVDAFQGREANVVIVDMVVAKDPVLDEFARDLHEEKLEDERRAREAAEAADADDAEEDDDLDNGTEECMKAGFITAYMRDPNRLNVALTRAKDGLVVVCQERMLCTYTKRSNSKRYAALMNMVTNARQRGIMGIMRDIEDHHPDAIQLRLKLGQEEYDCQRKQTEKADNHPIYGLIEYAKKASSAMRKQPAALAIKVPIYRTAKGHTTRPMYIGDKEVADAYDKKILEEGKVQGRYSA